MKIALTIAGSDSGAGAGIQADLKTFAACGVYGLSVVTAVTAQNTQGVFGVAEMKPAFVAKQMLALMKDIGCQAAKTGMLYNAKIIETVAREVKKHNIEPLVVDPVMVAKGGQPLLRPDAEGALIAVLLPIAHLVTPNLDEARRLAKMKQIDDLDQMQMAALKISVLGAKNVLVKGGHLAGDACDVLFDGKKFTVFEGPRIETVNTHGSGCTYSAAITAYLARGLRLEAAIAQAKKYVTGGIENSFSLGHGHGPLDHFWNARIS